MHLVAKSFKLPNFAIWGTLKYLEMRELAIRAAGSLHLCCLFRPHSRSSFVWTPQLYSFVLADKIQASLPLSDWSFLSRGFLPVLLGDGLSIIGFFILGGISVFWFLSSLSCFLRLCFLVKFSCLNLCTCARWSTSFVGWCWWWRINDPWWVLVIKLLRLFALIAIDFSINCGRSVRTLERLWRPAITSRFWISYSVGKDNDPDRCRLWLSSRQSSRWSESTLHHPSSL